MPDLPSSECALVPGTGTPFDKYVMDNVHVIPISPPHGDAHENPVVCIDAVVYWTCRT